MDRNIKLPEHLEQRSRWVQSGDFSGEYVVYWMQTAMRLDENPALDVAKCFACEWNLPLLIYQGLSERYRFASDRHHRFILEGIAELQEVAREKGLSYVFHLERPGHRQPHLQRICNDASLVVVEDMPVDPVRSHVKALKRSISTSILAVDTACIVPMQTLNRACKRAFEFRDKTRNDFESKVGQGWPDLDRFPKSFDIEQIGFESITIKDNHVHDLVAACEIDHSIPAVPETVGGTIAGYDRWNTFRDSNLKGYASKRNDPLADGTSRMSAYLHYGMVSPFRIAREARGLNGNGSEKFLDELFVWRELAYNFCFHRADHSRWTALPDWARKTLEEHAHNRRPSTYTWEELARGKTDDELWNACQRSLIRKGELHNNVRMTWGKAVLRWTEHPREALRYIIDLNHRFALDGRDPASYGGLLWCLGLFDRPFQPETIISGSIRDRPTREHAKRLDVREFDRSIANAYGQDQFRIAVIGAGLSGAVAARSFVDHGFSVDVFEKSRGAGGRTATRRSDFGTFDHGAQYFTARDPRFKRYVASWVRSGLVEEWPNSSLGQKIVVLNDGEQQSESRSITRYVGVPAMNSICKRILDSIEIQTQKKIDRVEKDDSRYFLLDSDGERQGPFDGVVVSAPAEQAADLVADFRSLSDAIREIKMLPCWACLVSFAEPVTESWVGAFLHNSFLSWTARSSTKPGRQSSPENVVIHASPEWTEKNWEEDPHVVAEKMLHEFWKVTGVARQDPVYSTAHRWKYSIPVEKNTKQCYADPQEAIVCCGDWANGSRVEGAFLSGAAAFGRLHGRLIDQRKIRTNSHYRGEHQKQLF